MTPTDVERDLARAVEERLAARLETARRRRTARERARREKKARRDARAQGPARTEAQSREEPIMTIRTDVVSLLCGIDMRGGPAAWCHEQDGRPLTDAERDLVLSATRDEVQAARDYAVRAQEYHAQQLADFERIEQLTRPYIERFPDSTTMGEIVGRMDEAERAELLQIMDRLAPDGMLWTPGGGA